MGKSLSLLLMGASLVMVGFSGFAHAGSPLTVLVDRSQLMQLTADPGTIIVGNPSIADVSLSGRQLFIHGRSAGETNLMVFDQGGSKIADFELSVTQDGANTLTMFTGSSGSGAARLSYVCAPICERTMVVGDSTSSFSAVVGDNQRKSSFAQGGVRASGNQGAPSTPAQ